jgi:hypothetical protein
VAEENAEVVRHLWAAIEHEAGMPWPPGGREELDRQLRLDLCDEQIFRWAVVWTLRGGKALRAHGYASAADAFAAAGLKQ